MCEEVGRRGATWGDVGEVGQCKARKGKARWRVVLGSHASIITMPRQYIYARGTHQGDHTECAESDLHLGVECRVRSSL